MKAGKLCPALMVKRLPGPYEDWLICMVSSQLRRYVGGFDELILRADADFAASGLKAPSVVRAGRLAVVESSVLVGSIGEVGPVRLQRVRERLAHWLAA